MKVVIDVDESLWKEIMNFISSKYKRPSKYRKEIINEILKIGFNMVKKGNRDELKKVLESYEVSDEFLDFMEDISKLIRERSVRRAWNYA